MKGNNLKGAMIAIAAAGLFAGCAQKGATAETSTEAAPAAEASGNSCKGPNGCGAAAEEAKPENSCSGANSCNGAEAAPEGEASGNSCKGANSCNS